MVNFLKEDLLDFVGTVFGQVMCPLQFLFSQWLDSVLPGDSDPPSGSDSPNGSGPPRHSDLPGDSNPPDGSDPPGG